MNKKKLDRIQYKVDKTSGVVVAVLRNCENDAINHLANVLDIDAYSELLGRCEISSTFRGVARCHPDDEFDEIVGKAVAVEKLEDKYNKAFNTAIDKLFIKLDNMLTSAMR